jgi:hypothetical protein
MLEQSSIGRDVLDLVRQVRTDAAQPFATEEDDDRAMALAFVQRLLRRWLTGRAR